MHLSEEDILYFQRIMISYSYDIYSCAYATANWHWTILLLVYIDLLSPTIRFCSLSQLSRTGCTRLFMKKVKAGVDAQTLLRSEGVDENRLLSQAVLEHTRLFFAGLGLLGHGDKSLGVWSTTFSKNSLVPGDRMLHPAMWAISIFHVYHTVQLSHKQYDKMPHLAPFV